MDNQQWKISPNFGNDSHVRDQHANIFTQSASQTFQMMAGEVLAPQPEPLFKQNYVTVKMARGGQASAVAWPGAFIDPITGNLHGSYEGPYPGQMVMIGFESGNSQSPFVVNRYPYQGTGNSYVEGSYITPLTAAGFSAQDVLMGHFSGSYLSFNTLVPLPGSVTLNAVTDMGLISKTNIVIDAIVTAEMKSAISKLTGSSHVELNGNTNFSIKYTEMKVAFDAVITQVNSNLALIATAIAGVGGTYTPVPVVSDMTPSKNLKVLM